jgi:hypothetical protein
MFTKACQRSLFQAGWIQSTPSLLTKIYINNSVPSSLVSPKASQTKIDVFILSHFPIHATYLTHLIPLNYPISPSPVMFPLFGRHAIFSSSTKNTVYTLVSFTTKISCLKLKNCHTPPRWNIQDLDQYKCLLIQFIYLEGSSNLLHL